MICEQCGKGTMKYTGKCFYSYPGQYEYKCTQCDYENVISEDEHSIWRNK